MLERLRAVTRLDRGRSVPTTDWFGNRREFLRAAADLGADGAVLLLDLDNFKPVNDAYGHAVGDRVLVSFAQALEYCVRGDVVCRIGGDEFAVVLRSGAPASTDTVLRRMTFFYGRPPDGLHLLPRRQPRAGEPVSATVARADDALYAAKAARHTGKPPPTDARGSVYGVASRSHGDHPSAGRPLGRLTRALSRPGGRVLDPRFERYRIDSAAVERIATGYRWAEGPVWFGDHGCLLWSDIPNNRMMRWDERTGAVSVFRSPSNFANGHIRDAAAGSSRAST